MFVSGKKTQPASGAAEEPLIFLHIPKTAGTTMRSILEKMYGRTEACFIYDVGPWFYSLEQFQALPDEQKGRYRLFCGHFAYGIHEHIPVPARYFTVLRDPVARTVSFYYHVKRAARVLWYRRAEYYRTLVSSSRMSLKDFVARGPIYYQTDNHQTRMISGLNPPFGECTEETLGAAKRNMRDHFAVVGLTERFDESVILMRRLFDWPTPWYAKQNVSRKGRGSSDLDPGTMEVLREHNRFDIELYEYAEGLLDGMIKGEGESFKEELEEFRAANAANATRGGSWGITSTIRTAVSHYLRK